MQDQYIHYVGAHFPISKEQDLISFIGFLDGRIYSVKSEHDHLKLNNFGFVYIVDGAYPKFVTPAFPWSEYDNLPTIISDLED